MQRGYPIKRVQYFGFGPETTDDTGTKLRICKAKEETLQLLDEHVGGYSQPREERNGGLTNYEVTIRGKKNLSSASRKVVMNRSIDLIEENPMQFKKKKKRKKQT